MGSASETPSDASCDICQGRPMIEGAEIEGEGPCTVIVPHCNSNPSSCGDATCDDLVSAVGLTCCPPDASETPSDASETPSDASETPSDASPPCDICQGRPIIDF